jgi:hypothetical protein
MKPDADTVIILDEIDIMSGCNSFYIDQFNKRASCYFLLSILKKYKTWIGFSATISGCSREITNQSFPQSVYIEIPSLIMEAGENSLISSK